jgi:hypothetical protein
VAVTGYTLSSLADRSTGAAHAQTLNGPVDGRIGDAGVTFEWRHEDGILVGLLTAPTAGWIAVGFNETPDLRNTRMVMAAVSVSPIRVEEHVALVPDHRPVGQLGQPPIVTQADGAYADSLSTLAFAVTHDVPGRPSLRLSEGANVGVMLAWSHEPDFDHHSAWRRHFPVTL